jgi:hypothetical protein
VKAFRKRSDRLFVEAVARLSVVKADIVPKLKSALMKIQEALSYGPAAN